jgi:cyclic beta-1,2-glucan synthetase
MLLAVAASSCTPVAAASASQIDALPTTAPVSQPAAAPFGPAPGTKAAPIALPKLEFFNGMGGFAEDGREYVTS